MKESSKASSLKNEEIEDMWEKYMYLSKDQLMYLLIDEKMSNVLSD